MEACHNTNLVGDHTYKRGLQLAHLGSSCASGRRLRRSVLMAEGTPLERPCLGGRKDVGRKDVLEVLVMNGVDCAHPLEQQHEVAGKMSFGGDGRSVPLRWRLTDVSYVGGVQGQWHCSCVLSPDAIVRLHRQGVHVSKCRRACQSARCVRACRLAMPPRRIGAAQVECCQLSRSCETVSAAACLHEFCRGTFRS